MSSPSFEQVLSEERIILAAIDLAHAYQPHVLHEEWIAQRNRKMVKHSEEILIATISQAKLAESQYLSGTSRETLIRAALIWAQALQRNSPVDFLTLLNRMALMLAVDFYEIDKARKGTVPLTFSTPHLSS